MYAEAFGTVAVANVYIEANNDVALNGTGTVHADNNVTVMAGNDMFMNDSSSIDAGNNVDIETGNDMLMYDSSSISADNNVTIDADGEVRVSSGSIYADNNVLINAATNIYLGLINALNTITLNAIAGGIIDNNGDDLNLSAINLILSAATGIGHADAIDTQVSNLQATNTDSGDINISNQGPLTIFGTGVVNNGGGNIDIVTASALFVEAVISVIGNGIINLLAQGADGDVVIRDTVSSEDGDINVTAQRDVITDGAFGNGITALNSSGLGNINVNAGQDVLLGSNPALYGNAYGYGDIYSNDGSINIIAGRDFIVDYYTWVGADGSGNINVNADRDINVITRVLGEESEIYTNSGWINLVSGRDITIGDLSDVTSNSGAIRLSAGDNITQGNGSTISTNAANVILEADMDDDGTGGVTQNGTAQVLSNGGYIWVTAGTGSFLGGEDILLGLLDAGSGGVHVATGLGSIFDNNGDALNLRARDYSYLRAPAGIIGTDTDPIDVCIQISDANLLNPPIVNGAPAISGLILEIGGVDGATGTSGNIRGIVRPGSGYNGVNGAPMIDFSRVLPPGNVYYEDTDMGGTCTVLPGYPAASNFGYRELIWPWPGPAAAGFFIPANLLALLTDGLRFRIPKKHVVDAFQITYTQGPVTTGVYFYHPLVEMGMYEMPALGLDMYEFIEERINAINPALMPFLPPEKEEVAKEEKEEKTA